MRPAVAGLFDQLAACAQPYPGAVMVAHPESMVDETRLGIGQLVDKLVKLKVLGVNEGVDLAECEQLVARCEPENCKHRMRPEYALARDIPVPQAATAAIERSIDARVHGFVDGVGFARACRLPMEC